MNADCFHIFCPFFIGTLFRYSGTSLHSIYNSGIKQARGPSVGMDLKDELMLLSKWVDGRITGYLGGW